MYCGKCKKDWGPNWEGCPHGHDVEQLGVERLGRCAHPEDKCSWVYGDHMWCTVCGAFRSMGTGLDWGEWNIPKISKEP